MVEKINQLVFFSNFLADEARKISLKYYKKKIKVISKKKSSFDPVTVADISIQKKINNLIGLKLEIGSLDITFHRDDYRERLLVPEVRGTNIKFSLEGKNVILVDDVLYSGRTVRAALDELNSFGRASKVQLAVLVDRGHRELPIKADYVGKNIPTHEGEHVSVTLTEIDGLDNVVLMRERE